MTTPTHIPVPSPIANRVARKRQHFFQVVESPRPVRSRNNTLPSFSTAWPAIKHSNPRKESWNWVNVVFLRIGGRVYQSWAWSAINGVLSSKRSRRVWRAARKPCEKRMEWQHPAHRLPPPGESDGRAPGLGSSIFEISLPERSNHTRGRVANAVGSRICPER